MTYTTENLGPSHPQYEHRMAPGLTQVQIKEDGQIVAHFYGPWAKKYARLLLVKLQEVDSYQEEHPRKEPHPATLSFQRGNGGQHD